MTIPARYRIVDLELSTPIEELRLAADETGIGLIGRWRGRPLGFVLLAAPLQRSWSRAALEDIARRHFAMPLLAARAEQALAARWPREAQRPAPALSVAICTKDRAQRLRRLLAALDAARATSPFARLEILVIDNASVDGSTRDAVASFPGMRYVYEARTGLDFARNAALHAASGELLAFLDDDVVIDAHWFEGLFAVWADCPDAGGYTGLVLPLRLDTPARIAFEQFGGFSRGYSRIHHRRVKFGNRLHPVGAGIVGAGCNMAFDRRLLLQLGGFDEALDTGAPLPGGGDLDIFYRVLRSGRPIVYEPRYAVFHEHRETLPQLRRQYWTWGLGFMAFLVKSRRTDATMRPAHAAMLRWWFVHQLGLLLRALGKRHLQHVRYVLAELRGAVQGLFGEYDRSLARSQRIRDSVAASPTEKAVQ